MFSDASNFVHGVDLSFAVIFGISLFFLIGITAVMIYFVFRYSKKRNPNPTTIQHNTRLEVIWTVIPTILVVVMFWYGWMGYKPMREIPDDAIPITAYAQMWSWQFEYENGKTSDTLVIPKDKPVVLNLVSRDVLHSLYIPAFRVKEDVVPGQEEQMWFIGQKEGDYDIFCAEYCGDRHSYMLSQVSVVPEQEYNTWLSTVSADPPGLAVLKKNACLSCHSLDGSRIVGPSFLAIWGKTETVITNGEERQVVVDAEYIAHSIKEPNADVVKGFNPGLMISYKELVSDEEIEDIIEYFKTLK
ncbi:MAG: cytochrome c oxidase subunit II [Bacteroidales bacterium]